MWCNVRRPCLRDGGVRHLFFFSSRRRHTRLQGDWSSDVCSSDLIDELGYVRHESARHLRAGHSRTLAYVVLDASNPFFTDVARGAQQVAEQAGLGLFLCNSNQDPTVEHHYLDLLAEQRVRGVLITPIDPDGKALSHLTRRGIPLVMVDRAADSHSCSVSVDDLAGGVMAARPLIE